MFIIGKHINIAYTPQLNVLFCGRWAGLRRWRYANINVPYWRLYWNDRSGAWFTAPGGTRHELVPKRFILVAPNTPLASDINRTVDHYYTHFMVGLPYTCIQNQVHRFDADPILVNAMRRDYGAQGAPVTARCLATALKLCWHALSTLPANLLPALNMDSRLNKVLQWWEAQKWRPASNGQLAARMAMHPTAFCRYFQRIMGCPPHAYGVLKRMEQACLLLHFSDLSIKQVAEATGFCDRYYFSYVFKKMRGVSPAAFRRHNVGALARAT